MSIYIFRDQRRNFVTRKLYANCYWHCDHYYSAPDRGTGYCFRAISFFVCLFVSLFLCQQHYEKTAGPICMKFSGKVWSGHGTTWFNFGSIRVNGSADRRSICYHRLFTIWFDCGLLAVLCCHPATENVMKLLFLAFCYVAAGGGVCCAPHHSLLSSFILFMSAAAVCHLHNERIDI